LSIVFVFDRLGGWLKPVKKSSLMTALLSIRTADLLRRRRHRRSEAVTVAAVIRPMCRGSGLVRTSSRARLKNRG